MLVTAEKQGQLIPRLAQLGHKHRYSREMMRKLSDLSSVNQNNVAQAVIIEGARLTEETVCRLHGMGAGRTLPIDAVMEICCPGGCDEISGM